MRSKDTIRQEFNTRIAAAMQSGDTEQLADVFVEFAMNLQNEILQDAQEYRQTNDGQILANRGVRVLTSKEKDYYSRLIDAMRSGNPHSAIAKITDALPETVIEDVLGDVISDFPLLGEIDFTNTKALTKMIINKQGTQLATWGALNTAINTELQGSIELLEVTHCKLSAYMVVSQDMLAEGPEWVDAYVRGILSEALGLGLTQGVVSGTGKDQPIGIFKDINGAVTEGVYPDKEAAAITKLDVSTFGTIAASLAVGPTGRPRVVPQILMIVNPVDYFKKILPASTYLTTVGTYVNNVFPYPTKIVQDVNVPEGKAAFGLGKRYKLCAGVGGTGGRIEYSDEYQFIEDNRTYKIKTYANGRPLDSNAFFIADITGLKSLQ